MCAVVVPSAIVEVEPLAVVVDAIPAIVTYIDAAQRYRVVNATFRSWFGPIFGDVLGRTVAEVVGPAAYEMLRGPLERALAGEAVAFETRVAGADGRLRWVHGDYTPDLDAGGAVRGIVGLAYDITNRKRAEERLAILAEAGRALAHASDADTVHARLAAVAVPTLADWAAVYIDTDGVLTPTEVAHGDAIAPEEAWRLARSLLASRGDVARVQEIEAGSVALAPLVARGARLGALALGARPGSWDAADLALVDELARRGSAALELAEQLEVRRRTAARLEEADRKKDEFLALLGHELRDPLAPIATALDVVELRGDGPPELEVIRRQIAHLTRLVGDLLDISRITSGMLELARRPVELDAIMQGAIELASPQLERGAHDLAVDVPPGLVVDGDPDRLAQVFANLLTNAARYTPQHGHVAIVAARDAGEVVVRVTDDGIGIAPDLLPHVFEPFVQGKLRAAGGLGLGLALVKSLVERHGGAVEAASAGAGRGSAFTVRLPASAARVLDPPRRRLARSSTHARGRLLVVDDNVDAAALLGQLLRELGYDVAIAHDAPAALELAARQPPEIALLDLGLPLMDGYELAQRLRASHAPVRLVAVTGYGRPPDIERGRAAGFEHHLGKPVDVHRLADVLRQLTTRDPGAS